MKIKVYSQYILLSFMLMLLPACTCRGELYYRLYVRTGEKDYSKSSVGNIYDFIFGSENLGKYNLGSTEFNIPMFLGFLAIIIAFILSVKFLYFDNRGSDVRANCDFLRFFNIQSIFSGIALLFLSPIYTHKAVFDFYESLPNSYKSDYDDFRYGYGCVVLFIFLFIIFIHNLYSAIKVKNIE